MDAGTYTVAWNNGQTSIISYAETSRFGMGQSIGRIVRGEFKGLALRLHDLEGATPEICVLNHGRTMGFYLGTTSIG